MFLRRHVSRLQGDDVRLLPEIVDRRADEVADVLDEEITGS
jgi:hypothetical protein